MCAYQAGDEEAFAGLFDRYQRPLLTFFYKMCYDRAMAEDLTQETFLRLIRHKAGWRPDASFATWLYTVARNLWIDRHRSRRAAPKTVSADLPTSEEGGTAGDRLETREEDPVKQVADREAAGLVRRAIEDLPEGQRMVFLLAETQGLKYREIAEILEVPVGTVKSRMNAAVVRLRAFLGRVLR